MLGYYRDEDATRRPPRRLVRPRRCTRPIPSTDPVNAVAFAHDGRTLAVGMSDGTVLLWDTNTHKPARAALTGHTNSGPGARLVARFRLQGRFRRLGRIVWLDNLSISRRAALTSRDVTAAGSASPLPGPTVTSVAFSPDGKLLASGSADRTVRLWKI